MATPVTYPRFKAFVQGTNAPLSGGTVEFYVAGTSTPAPVYADAQLATSLGTIVTLDANGEKEIWPNPITTYKLIVKNSVGTIQFTQDNWGVASSTAPASVVGHNMIVNGGFDLWQAGPTFAGNNGAAPGCFNADGWAHRVEAGTGAVTDYTISRQGTFNITSFLAVERNNLATSNRTISIVQNIEAADAFVAQGLFVVFSMSLKQGGAATYTTVTISLFSGTSATDESWQTAAGLTGQSTVSQLVVPTPPTIWTQYTSQSVNTIPVPASANALTLVIALSGFTGTSDGNDELHIKDVKLELGTTVTGFIHDAQQELNRKGQRRYYKTFPVQTTPAQSAGLPGAISLPQTVGAAAAMASNLWVPSWMRDTTGSTNVPGTVTTFNPSAANANARNTTVAADCGAPTILSEAGNNVVISTMNSAAGSAAGNNNRLHYTVDRRF
jgi:hypothetical protein